MTTEQNRLAFLAQRDGLPAARQWAAHTAAIYRTAVLNKNHHASTRVYRRRFILSYLEFKRYANEQ